jgi:magnesium-transporting ATPase (P-type)
MLNTSVKIFKAIGLAPVRYDRATHKYCITINGYLITFLHIAVLIYCSYSHWWANDFVTEDPVESRQQSTISEIYLKSYWYLSIVMRTSYFLIVFVLIRPYLDLLNGLLAIEATWEMIDVDVQQRSRKFVIGIFIALVLVLHGPFVGVAFQDTLLRFNGWPNWSTFIVWHCGELYMPGTIINFLICGYYVKMNFDRICNFLQTRIQ